MAMKITEAQLVKATKAAAAIGARRGYHTHWNRATPEKRYKWMEEIRTAFAAAGVTVKPERKKR